jgi:hypothetical protein
LLDAGDASIDLTFAELAGWRFRRHRQIEETRITPKH